MPYRLADAYFECGKMLIEKGDKELAAEYLEGALDIFQKLGNMQMLEKTKMALGEL
jgi:hypothetical protein